MIGTSIKENLSVVALATAAVSIVLNILLFSFWQSAHDDLVANKAVTKQVAERADAVIKTQKQITEDTTNGWKAAVDYLRAHPVRVLQPAGSFSGISVTPAGADGAGADAVPAARDVETDCAKTTLQLNWLQNWAEKQEAIK